MSAIEPDSFDRRADSPPLGIIHLLAWTAITAASLALQQWLSGIPRPGAFELIDRVWFAAVLGVALGAILLMVARRFRGIPFPTEPGEYYLVAAGIGEAIFLACWAIFHHMLDPMPGAGVWFYYLASLLGLIPNFWAAYRVTAPGWRQFLWVWFGLNLVQSLLISSRLDRNLLDAYWVIAGLEISITLVWIPILWRADHRHQIHRGWLHGIGTLVWLLSSLHVLGWWLWAFLGTP